MVCEASIASLKLDIQVQFIKQKDLNKNIYKKVSNFIISRVLPVICLQLSSLKKKTRLTTSSELSVQEKFSLFQNFPEPSLVYREKLCCNSSMVPHLQLVIRSTITQLH